MLQNINTNLIFFKPHGLLFNISASVTPARPWIGWGQLFKGVAKCKVTCPMHSEAKQTETLEFGAEKGLLQGPSKENEWLVLKNNKLPDGFERRVFIGKIWGEGSRVCDFLLTGWW